MEDEHSVELWTDIADNPCLLIGVFDGHFGSDCSKFLADKLPRTLKQKLEQGPLQAEEIHQVFTQAFAEVDK